MVRISEDAFDTLTLFAKISLALGAASLLFLDDRSIDALRSCSRPLSIVSEACLGLTFVASVILVAVWDCALAILVCLFLACWIAALQRQAQTRRAGTTGGKAGAAVAQAGGAQARLHAASRAVSASQASAISAQTARDNAGRLRYAIDTPLPTPNEQTSIPMAYAMADRSYSTTAV